MLKILYFPKSIFFIVATCNSPQLATPLRGNSAENNIQCSHFDRQQVFQCSLFPGERPFLIILPSRSLSNIYLVPPCWEFIGVFGFSGLKQMVNYDLRRLTNKNILTCFQCLKGFPKGKIFSKPRSQQICKISRRVKTKAFFFEQISVQFQRLLQEGEEQNSFEFILTTFRITPLDFSMAIQQLVANQAASHGNLQHNINLFNKFCMWTSVHLSPSQTTVFASFRSAFSATDLELKQKFSKLKSQVRTLNFLRQFYSCSKPLSVLFHRQSVLFDASPYFPKEWCGWSG